jgi:hypothetical protein
MVTCDNSVEQEVHFKYLSGDVTYEMDQDLNQKIKKIQATCGTVQNTERENKTRHAAKILLHYG